MAFWNKKKVKKPPIQKKTATKPPEKKVEKPKPQSRPPMKEAPKPKSEPPKSKSDPEKEFLKVFKELTYRHRDWDIWRDFVVMTASALSNPVDKEHFNDREARYMKIIKKYNKKEQNIFPELFALTVMALDENPEQDFLGTIFMRLNLGSNMKGQIFTPYHVCEPMAKVSMGENLAEQVKEQGYITINDPCCGAGATLIAGINEAKRQLAKVNLNFQNHVLVAAQDIDETVALMCYIQLSLLGVAAYIKIGNSLTEPMSSEDTTENYWYTPMYFSDVWFTRRLFHQISDLTKGDA